MDDYLSVDWPEDDIERDARFAKELAAMDVFTRIPPELAADPQPSTWLDDTMWLPHLPIVEHEPIPGWQLRGYRVGPSAYTLWRIADTHGEGCPLVGGPYRQPILFSLPELTQAVELLSGEILRLVPELLPSIAYFLPRDRPY